MKTPLTLLVILSVSVCFTPRAKSQWAPDGTPNWTTTEFLTVGGITYFRGVSRMNNWCERLAGYAVSREGTNLSQVIQQEYWTGICICNTVECGPPPDREIASVLGGLPAGDYRLTIRSTNRFSLFPPSSSAFTFTVPTNSSRTLTISGDAGNSRLQIYVAGISNVQYVLERSPNLITWNALRTNLGAPVTFVQTNSGNQQFYRARIEPTAPAQ